MKNIIKKIAIGGAVLIGCWGVLAGPSIAFGADSTTLRASTTWPVARCVTGKVAMTVQGIQLSGAGGWRQLGGVSKTVRVCPGKVVPIAKSVSLAGFPCKRALLIKGTITFRGWKQVRTQATVRSCSV